MTANAGLPGGAATGSRWRIWMSAARPRTLPAAVAPVLVGTALAQRDGVADFAAAAVCLVFALLVQIGTNFANDYYDFVHGADTAARVGPRRAVAAGLISARTMRTAMIVVLATAFGSGLTLLAWGGPWLLLVGVASILCGIAYTGGPWPLAYHGLGDVFVFLFFGLVAVGATYFVQAGRIGPDVWAAAAAIGLLTTNILVVNNYRDAETDALAGKRTLVVRWGRPAARAQHAISIGLALALPVWWTARDQTAWRLLPLLVLPMALRQIAQLRSSRDPAEQIQLLGATGQLLAVYALLLSVAVLR
jgi:1,4-dihydroxy-2-naphthoate octaprenyltransferase